LETFFYFVKQNTQQDGFMASKSALRNENLADATSCGLILVDFQTKLLPVIQDGAKVVGTAAKMLEAAKLLDIPVIMTEHVPDKLGATHPDLNTSGVDLHSKISFSALGAESVFNAITQSKVRQWVVCGIEAHICVLQTAFDLLHNTDSWVFVVSDAVGSRTPENKELGLQRIRDEGAQIVSSEMVMFEWLRSADHANFRDVSKLVK
jgi:nicotinamidase-related amidase